jgi:hypothetical protein
LIPHEAGVQLLADRRRDAAVAPGGHLYWPAVAALGRLRRPTT